MVSRLMKPCSLFILFLFSSILLVCNKAQTAEKQTGTFAESDSKVFDQKGTTMPEKIIKSDEEWKRILTPEQYKITRKKGTEPPFTGKYNNFKEKGIFQCVCCGNDLFRSDLSGSCTSAPRSFGSTSSDLSSQLCPTTRKYQRCGNTRSRGRYVHHQSRTGNCSGVCIKIGRVALWRAESKGNCTNNDCCLGDFEL